MKIKKFIKKYPDGTKIDVLGTTYSLVYRKIKGNDLGRCDWWAKEIIIDLSWFKKAQKKGKGNLNRLLKTLRYECISAFFYELGNLESARDDRLLDELSVKTFQFMELLKPFMEKKN